MASITSAGIGSGLDINGLVTQLVEAEAAAPTARLNRRQSDLQLRLSAYGQLKSQLSSLSTSLTGLKNSSTFTSYTARSSDSDVFTATGSGNVTQANYDINVTALAETHKLSTDPTLAAAQFTDVTDNLSTGTLTFKFGTTTYNEGTDAYTGFVQNPDKASATVTITDSSLEGVRDAINGADIGVTAALIFDGSHYRLTLSSDDTGADNSLQITVSDDDGVSDDDAGLSLLTFNGTATHLQQNEAAKDAALTINGIAISSSSNTVSDAIDGVNIKVKSTGSAELNVDTDKTKIKSAITQFVGSYNAFIGTVNQLTAYNPDTQVAGELNGDGVTRNILSSIQTQLSSPVGTLGDDFTILAEIGITSSPADGGRLKIDDTVLDEQLDENFDKFIALFSAYGETTDSYTNFVTSTDDTVVGNYAVNITTLASKGQLTGSAASNLTITGGSNDEITLDINGVSATVTLTAGTYTAAELATELQAKVNNASAFSNAGLSVEVTESAGVLSLISQSYGSSSTVNVTGGNGATDLLGATPVSTDGVDVAGTIGGVAATGNGQSLTGSGDADGLLVVITGATLGDRGSIDFKRGYADRLSSYIDTLLDTEGFFTSTTKSLENRLKDIASDRLDLADRLERIETRLRAQFGALDALVAQLQSTSSFLQQQLSSLPPIGGSNNR